jgi:replicative DNA helicase
LSLVGDRAIYRSNQGNWISMSTGLVSKFKDAVQNKLPPQNLEAEQGVLGSIVLSNIAIDEVAEILHASHFYSDAHQRIYKAVMTLHEKGIRGIDAVTLHEELSRNNELEEVGGEDYLIEIIGAVPHAAHARYYAEIVRDKWIQRSLTYACNEILGECYEGGRETEDILASAEQKIFSILEQQEHVEKMAINDILIDAFDRINARLEKEGQISGMPTGFADLDHLLNGFQPSELLILAARPSMGKTALVCNIAESAAANGTTVLMFSLEQSKLELAERLLCIRARVNGHHLRAGELDEVEQDKLNVAAQELSLLPLFIDDAPGRTMAQMGAICRRLKRRDNLGLIIIDYLQLIEPEDKKAPREQQIALISRRLKFLAKEIEAPVVALAQLNRGVELREDKRPRLADLRESGSIEQDADVVMFLHRPAAYDPEDRPGEADLIVAKNRSGPAGFISLAWLSETMRFGDLTRVPDEADFH